MTTQTSRSLPGFFGGLSMPFRGFGFVVRNPGLAKIWIFPVLIVFGLLVLGCGGASEVGRFLADRFAPLAAEGSASGMVEGVVDRAGHAIARIVFTMIGVALSILFSIVLAPVVAAPFNDALGEEVELRELGKTPLPFSWSRLRRDLWRTVRLELTKLGLYAGVVGPLSILGIFVGPLAAVASALGFVFTAGYFALDYVDGPLTRRNVGVRRRFELFREHPAAMLGFGIGVWFMLVVPLLNLFFMPAAVAGGTMLCIRLGLLEEIATDEGTADAPSDELDLDRTA